MGFENNFIGIYFHRHFYPKTGVSRNGLSLGYSERDTSTVANVKFQFPPFYETTLLQLGLIAMARCLKNGMKILLALS